MRKQESERDLERLLTGTDDDAINIKHTLCLAAVLGLCCNAKTCVSVSVSVVSVSVSVSVSVRLGCYRAHKEHIPQYTTETNKNLHPHSRSHAHTSSHPHSHSQK